MVDSVVSYYIKVVLVVAMYFTGSKHFLSTLDKTYLSLCIVPNSRHTETNMRGFQFSCLVILL